MIGHQFTAICCSTSTLVPDWWWPWGWTELDGPRLHDSQPAVQLFTNTLWVRQWRPAIATSSTSLAARLSIRKHFQFVTSNGCWFIRHRAVDSRWEVSRSAMVFKRPTCFKLGFKTVMVGKTKILMAHCRHSQDMLLMSKMTGFGTARAKLEDVANGHIYLLLFSVHHHRG